jgi:hypothetical protein
MTDGRRRDFSHFSSRRFHFFVFCASRHISQPNICKQKSAEGRQKV